MKNVTIYKEPVKNTFLWALRVNGKIICYSENKNLCIWKAKQLNIGD